MGGSLQEWKGLHSRTYSLHESVFKQSGKEAARTWVHLYRPRQQATCPSVKPRILAGSSKNQGSHLQRPARGHFTIISLGVWVQYGAHSSPTHFFFFVCQSAFLNSFQRKKPCVVCPRRLQGAHGARVILWLHKTALQWLCCYTKAPSKC